MPSYSSSLRAFLPVLAIAGLANVSPAAAKTLKVTFVTHASFFSHETKQAKPLDPQVFVADPSAPSATGPQGIAHVAGVRPALIDEDAKTTPLFNADDKPLGFDLGQWLGARGTVRIEDGAKVRVSASFRGLRPHGHYSLFENHFDEKPIGFTPLDGKGTANNFVADSHGRATVHVVAPAMLTHANAVLLVYHSDGKDHGMERGLIGVLAHHQLIARPN